MVSIMVMQRPMSGFLGRKGPRVEFEGKREIHKVVGKDFCHVLGFRALYY